MTQRFEFTPTTKAKLMSKGACCWACGVPACFGVEFDHVIPRKLGNGEWNPNCHNGESNGQILCAACNKIKGNVTFAVKPRKPYWNPDMVKMSQQINANRRKFTTLIKKARARQ